MERTILGKRIEQLRTELGLNQIELAKKLNLSSSASISQYESGERTPSDELKLKMAEIFNCSLDYLMGKSDIRNAEEANFEFAYHKDIDTKGLTAEDIKEALEIYRMLKARENKEKKSNDKK